MHASTDAASKHFLINRSLIFTVSAYLKDSKCVLHSKSNREALNTLRRNESVAVERSRPSPQENPYGFTFTQTARAGAVLSEAAAPDWLNVTLLS